MACLRDTCPQRHCFETPQGVAFKCIINPARVYPHIHRHLMTLNPCHHPRVSSPSIPDQPTLAVGIPSRLPAIPSFTAHQHLFRTHTSTVVLYRRAAAGSRSTVSKGAHNHMISCIPVPRRYVCFGAQLRSPVATERPHEAVLGARSAAGVPGRACSALKKAPLGGSDLEVTNACIGTMVSSIPLQRPCYI